MKKELIYIVVAFVAGAVIAVTVWPSKVKIETKVVEKVVEVEVEKIKVVKEIVEVSTSESKQESTRTRKVTSPDGTVVEETITESSSEQVAKIQRELEESYREKERQRLAELEKQKIKEITNPKKLSLLVGINKDQELAGSLHYNLVGPINIGIIGTRNDLFLGLGIQF